jgi:hypothetical protein
MESSIMRNPKDDPKLRKPRPTQADDSEVGVPEASNYLRPHSYSFPRTTQVSTAAESTRGKRSADARTLKRYGSTRAEVDAFISEHYATKGPKWVADQLGVTISTVIMRARKLGLPPLQ